MTEQSDAPNGEAIFRRLNFAYADLNPQRKWYATIPGENNAACLANWNALETFFHSQNLERGDDYQCHPNQRLDTKFFDLTGDAYATLCEHLNMKPASKSASEQRAL